jgi:hypothetical protein
MKQLTVRMVQLYSTDESLTIFLGLLVVTVFVLIPLDDLGVIGSLIFEVIFTLLLISGVVTASTKSRSTMMLAIVMAALTLSLRWMHPLFPGIGLATAKMLSALLALSLFASAVLYQTLREGRITMQRVYGAIAAYLLLGLIWGFAYELVQLHSPGAFQETTVSDQPGLLTSKLVYFSFVTLTTVGYGDITPVNPIARSLANLESLIGQLYPAILIARLVSLEIHSRQSK